VEWNLAYHQYQHNRLKSGYRKGSNVLDFSWPVTVVHFILDVLQVTNNAYKTNIFMIFVHFETSSAFKPGLNMN
jgi:hypothetical protein